MLLSNAALNWASVRSGLGLGDFLSSLTPEKEQEEEAELLEETLEQLGSSVEALRMAAQITWEEYRRRHKGTAAISAF